MSNDHVLWHQSGVNKHGEPFVQLLQDDHVICQLTPEQARDHAKNILEATEAAEQDAFMVEFFKTKIGADDRTAAMLLMDFRAWREARGKKGPPSDPREFLRTDQHEKLPSQSGKGETT